MVHWPWMKEGSWHRLHHFLFLRMTGAAASSAAGWVPAAGLLQASWHSPKQPGAGVGQLQLNRCNRQRLPASAAPCRNAGAHPCVVHLAQPSLPSTQYGLHTPLALGL